MKQRTYADHAATTPLMPEALETMLPFLKENFGNPSSLHGWAKPARKAVDEARTVIELVRQHGRRPSRHEKMVRKGTFM